MIYQDDCLLAFKHIFNNSIDSLVTDPPAGISFMGKDWDHHRGGRDEWIAWMTDVMRECLRVMKPGAHGLVWAIPRTSHWTATALENAGFEIRDIITHLFGSGFPKSLDISKAIDKAAGAEREMIGKKPWSNQDTRGNPISGTGGRVAGEQMDKPRLELFETAPATDSAKQWQGWGTALKPASEHWILIRKPLSEKTVAANVLKWGVGGINIDGCRIEAKGYTKGGQNNSIGFGSNLEKQPRCDGSKGRFPANLVLDEQAAEMLDGQSGILKSGARNGIKKARESFDGAFKERARDTGKFSGGSVGGASRFFYVAKASKSDRGEGNNHPTVKSTKLMEYLIKLVTPSNGIVLDPFMGSGSTGKAAKNLGFGFIGIEKEKEYFEIAKKRLGCDE